MKNNQGFNNAIGITRIVMLFLGVWPNPKKKENWFSRYFILVPSFTMMCFCNIPQTIQVTRVWGDFNAVLKILTVSDISVGIALFKLLNFWFQKNVLGQLIVSMVEDWNKPKTKKELHIMWTNAKLSRIISITIISLAEGTIITQFMMTVLFAINDSKYYDFDEYNITLKSTPLFFNGVFPYNVEKSPYYEITWILQFFSAIFAASAFSAVDAFFAVLVLHLCSQLKNLKDNLKRLPIESSFKDDEHFLKLLSNIIIRHECLERFANVIEDSFNVMFLIQVILSSVVLCLQCYQIVVITTTGDEIPLFEFIFLSYYTLCFIFSLFVYCYVADALQTESMQIGYAVYESDWYNLAPAKTKYLLLIMIRVKQPFKITAGKFVALSLEYYCRILKSTCGYLSLLLAVKRRLVN